MPLLGLIDWILIGLLALLVGFGVTCFLLMGLHELFSFKPDCFYRPSTRLIDEEGNTRIVEAPRNYHEHHYERLNNLKWYHELIFGQ